MVSKLFLTALLTVSIISGCDQKPAASGKEGTTTTVSDATRCPHEIKKEKCPFCTPTLIDSDGFCGEHGVAEALCYKCRPYLKAAFRAKGDWCKDHDAPESQCMTCHPELKDKIKPGQHGTPVAPVKPNG